MSTDRPPPAVRPGQAHGHQGKPTADTGALPHPRVPRHCVPARCVRGSGRLCRRLTLTLKTLCWPPAYWSNTAAAVAAGALAGTAQACGLEDVCGHAPAHAPTSQPRHRFSLPLVPSSRASCWPRRRSLSSTTRRGRSPPRGRPCPTGRCRRTGYARLAGVAVAGDSHGVGLVCCGGVTSAWPWPPCSCASSRSAPSASGTQQTAAQLRHRALTPCCTPRQGRDFGGRARVQRVSAAAAHGAAGSCAAVDRPPNAHLLLERTISYIYRYA